MASSESLPEVLDKDVEKEGDINDVEKIEPIAAHERNNDRNIERIATHEKPLVDRPSPRKWFLTCVGLYLGALLYGKSVDRCIADSSDALR